MEQSNRISQCTRRYVVTNSTYRTGREEHDPDCPKCMYKAKANSICIHIHEWPLSSDQYVAKSTVFELRVPQGFETWRNLSLLVWKDVLGSKYCQKSKPRAYFPLRNDNGLEIYIDRATDSRFGVLSEIKPHERTHRNERGNAGFLSLTEADVCLKNGLKYAYFDNKEDVFTDLLKTTEKVLQSCTFRLPERSSQLQDSIRRPPSQPDGIPPNEVIAKQSRCPAHMALNEYKAFCTLPLGHVIQYKNILTQLSMPALDFSKVESQLLILQTILQAGPPSREKDVERAAHKILAGERFGEVMLNEIELALQRTCENWESWRALSTFVQLAIRILTLTESSVIRSKCLHYLAKSRQVCKEWFDHIRGRARVTIDDDQRGELYHRSVEIALLCISTFDVDQPHAEAILQEPSVASLMLQCAMAVEEDKNSASSDHQALYLEMLQSWRSLAYRVLPTLKHEIIQQGSSCLDDAIASSWPGFRSSGVWQSNASPRGHWLMMKSQTNKSSGAKAYLVHFNLLTAELLVNGKPLARLPGEYRIQKMYPLLFGTLSLEVMPSTIARLPFSAKHTYRDFQLCLGMEGNDLLIRATQGSKSFDLIPRRLLELKLPTAFTENYIHWYNYVDNTIEFRSSNDPWCTSSTNWCLQKIGQFWRLNKPGVTLVSLSSETQSALSTILSPLESKHHIHIQLDHYSQCLDIDLPRLELSFRVGHRSSRVESRQYGGTYVDPDQECGVLVGLSSKLILMGSYENRLVLIPEGSVSCSKAHHHVAVRVDENTVTKVHAYQLDTTLGRLVYDGSLQGRLYLAYLHALTSFCLPDPLTGHTGTESAISILRSSAVRSFNVLSEDNIRTLKLISKLSPARGYYPQNEKVMQQVDWDKNLSFLSQDSRFYTLVQEIFTQTQATELLYPSETFTPPSALQHINPELLQRDILRSALFRVSGYGAEDYTTHSDRKYQSRDSNLSSDRGKRSFVAARLVIRQNAALHYKSHEQLYEKLKSQYFKAGVINGPSVPFPRLEFDMEWLSDASSRISESWCGLHCSLASSATDHHNKFDIIMWLCMMAFAENADMDVVEIFSAAYRMGELRSVDIPQERKFDLSVGSSPCLTTLKDLLHSASRRFNNCPDATLPIQIGETETALRQRRAHSFEYNRDRALSALAQALKDQWPCRRPNQIIPDGVATYLDFPDAMNKIYGSFEAWYSNRNFYLYLRDLCSRLGRLVVEEVIVNPILVAEAPTPPAGRGRRYISNTDIFASPVPSLKPGDLGLSVTLCLQRSKYSRFGSRLAKLCQDLDSLARTKSEREYVMDLKRSFTALQKSSNDHRSVTAIQEDADSLAAYLRDCEEYFRYMTERLQAVAQGELQQSHRFLAAYIKNFPRICPSFWVQQLNKKHWDNLSEEWKHVIVEYGLVITDLQRARRLSRVSSNSTELLKEVLNRGHLNWDPYEFPEALLLEIESGIMIREVQEEIAGLMRDPPNNENAVMQLNMGEGKSTVIVPLVAALLADSTKLVRVIVARPQSKQMFQMLVSKLGGLINRRVYHLPFSRTVKLDQPGVEKIHRMFQECMETRGTLLVQPEHLLSFGLMGLECLLSERLSIGESMLQTQAFLDDNARDIVDESDENLSVKFELMYTMGLQRPIEMSPDRWTIIQRILGMLPRFAMDVKKLLPDSLEIDDRLSGRFPKIRILRDDATEALLDSLASHICTQGFTGFPIGRQHTSMREAVRRYIREPKLSVNDIDQVEKGIFWTDTTKNTLLLVRGLIAGGVLRFVLGSKRWRVNFGIDINRSPKTMLAVPFRSKDCPSPRSEFSHPDVVIVLTSLAYYYGGLDEVNFFDTFARLLTSDRPDIEYGDWIAAVAHAIPTSFRQLSGVNIKDRAQCLEKLFPVLRYSKGMIDFFLGNLVFPREMKEFPHKLSASGWNLGKVKKHPLTGFSGTNDSRHLLPLSVQHLDLSTQKHTNALVLEYLLRDENSVRILGSRAEFMGSDAENLLRVVQTMSPPTRVILDVGAQILELNNNQVAEKWLQMSDDEHTKAVVFFSNDEELSVLDRRGHVELLNESPFSKQLGDCLIYLDEAHTRGTDLKLPTEYRAAVTLGPHLTKDRLVQACMRMRSLGKGQSVVFCVPEDVQTKINAQRSVPKASAIEVSHVLVWAVSETWKDLRRSMPIWATQGRRFQNHKDLYHGASTTVKDAEQLLEIEAKSLEAMYRPMTQNGPGKAQFDIWDTSNESIKQIVNRCEEFDVMNFDEANLQEEQERELAHEIEEERQLELPPPMHGEDHRISEGLLELIKHGDFLPQSKGLLPAFRELATCSPAQLFDLSQFPNDLLVTWDFVHTVKGATNPFIISNVLDSYQRPVQWVVSFGPQDDLRLLIISPFEANQLLADIRQSPHVTLHLYAPRTNMAYEPLDDMDLYTIGKPFRKGSISRSSIFQLNLFAGQLYFRSFEEYVELCECLGLAWTAAKDDEKHQADGFVVSSVGKWGLKNSPISFLKVFLTKIRLQCEGIGKTHMGKVVDGTLLEKGEIEEGSMMHYTMTDS